MSRQRDSRCKGQEEAKELVSSKNLFKATVLDNKKLLEGPRER
jgi:hypothetical protein